MSAFFSFVTRTAMHLAKRAFSPLQSPPLSSIPRSSRLSTDLGACEAAAASCRSCSGGRSASGCGCGGSSPSPCPPSPSRSTTSIRCGLNLGDLPSSTTSPSSSSSARTILSASSAPANSEISSARILISLPPSSPLVVSELHPPSAPLATRLDEPPPQPLPPSPPARPPLSPQGQRVDTSNELAQLRFGRQELIGLSIEVATLGRNSCCFGAVGIADHPGPPTGPGRAIARLYFTVARKPRAGPGRAFGRPVFSGPGRARPAARPGFSGPGRASACGPAFRAGPGQNRAWPFFFLNTGLGQLGITGH